MNRGGLSYRDRPGRPWRYLLLAIWLLFTLSLAGWWLFFSLSQVDRIHQLGGDTSGEILRHQKMIVWEGATLLISLLLGGAFLAYYMRREIRHGRILNDFLLAFTHEMKTTVASLQLQAEVFLEESSTDKSVSKRLEGLLSDLSSLGLQLDNALSLSNLGSSTLLREPVSLRDVVSSMSIRYPDIALALSQEGVVYADRRAIEIILANIIQNAKVHGKATAIQISIKALALGRLKIRFSDNGSGFAGDRRSLGQKFKRHYSGSGSGIGLYLSRSLLRTLGGAISYPRAESGFVVDVELEGRI